MDYSIIIPTMDGVFSNNIRPDFRVTFESGRFDSSYLRVKVILWPSGRVISGFDSIFGWLLSCETGLVSGKRVWSVLHAWFLNLSSLYAWWNFDVVWSPVKYRSM